MSVLRLPIAIIGIAILGWVGWTIVQVTRADALAHDDPEAALRIDADHPEALLRLARQQLGAKDYDAATATARHLLNVEPGQGNAFAVIALAAAGRGDADAQALTGIALRRAPRNLDIRTQAMVAALQKGDLDEAVRQLDAMLRLSPKRGTILFPAMAAQAIDPGFAAVLASTLARSPPWGPAFLAVLGSRGSQEAVDRIYSGLKEHGALSEAEVRLWLDRKLEDGRWGEAYAHWVGTLPQQPGTLSPVHDGGFENDPTSLGFDWRKGNVAGVFSSLEATPGASGTRAAHFHFIGRPTAGGDLRQALFLAPGRYALSLRAKAEFLHSDQGLQWIIRCQGGPVVATLGPIEGSFDWRAMSVAFAVPSEQCPGQWLELQNPAVTGSAQQVTGDLWIDDIAIAPGKADPWSAPP